MADRPSPLAQAIADTVRESVLVLGPDLRVAAANAAFYAVSGATPEDTLGQSVYTINGGVWDRPLFRRLLEEELPRAGRLDRGEVEREIEGIGTLVLRFRARLAGDHVVLVVDDVTAHREAERALRETEERFDLFAATAREYAVIGLDDDARITTWSPSAERLTGWTEAEAVGQPGSLLFTPEDRAGGAVEHELATARAEGSALDERWHLRKDGSRFWGTGVLVALRDGPLRGFARVFRDDTQRKEAEEARDHERALLTAILDALPVGVVITDARGRISRVNDVTRELWGVPPETASWEAYEGWVGWWPETGERIRADEWAMSRALREGVTTRGELIENQRFGSEERRFYLNNVAPLRDATGQIVGGVAAMLDVTDRRRAEEEVRRLNRTLEDRVARRTHQVRSLAQALTLAEQDERRRIAHILHDDVQQVLAGAQIKASLGDMARVESLLAEAIQLTRRLAHELSPPLLRGRSLSDLLLWLVERKRELYGLDIHLDIEGDVQVEREDLRVLLYHLLRELLFNVAKHAGTTEARVRAEPFRGGARVTVEDQGAGFEPTSLTRAKGFGLGLASVFERLELVGGRLLVESTPGEGTRVTIELPGSLSGEAPAP